MESRVAIIAGAGRFPFHVAREAKRQGLTVLAMGIQGWVDPALASQVDAYEEIGVGQIGRFVERLKSHHIRQAVMAGKVTKEVLLDQRTEFDDDARRILEHARELSVPSLLGAIGQRLAADGIVLLDSSAFLKAHLCPLGLLTSRPPTAGEAEDIALGVQAARALADLDIGQTVVVKHRVVIALEALEGTDVAIRRGAALAGRGMVVVKMASAQQDRRCDLPVVGIDTISTLREAGGACLAVEAQATLLLDRPALIAAANAAGLSLVGVSPLP